MHCNETLQWTTKFVSFATRVIFGALYGYLATNSKSGTESSVAYGFSRYISNVYTLSHVCLL